MRVCSSENSSGVCVCVCVCKDEEDGDTYEAPPKCDSPTVKAPPMPVEEDMYLGNTSSQPPLLTP